MMLRSLNEFRNAFAKAGRRNYFSEEALEELFRYYKELEEEWEPEPLRISVEEICLDWTEHYEDSMAAHYYGYNTVEELSYLHDVIYLGRGNRGRVLVKYD